MDPDIWCPPTFVGNSGIECFNGDRGLALLFCLLRFCFPAHIRHTPRKRGIQYAAAPQCDHKRLWNTGSPAFAGDDSGSRPCMTAIPSKADLRTAALAKREALSDEQRAAAAQAMAKRGLPFAIEPGLVVSGYSPIRSEIDPAPLMRKLAGQGAKLALPAVLSRGKSLAFRAWSPDDRLMLGPLGILEPSPAAEELVPDIMLVPLAAFDRARSPHRLRCGALRLHARPPAQNENHHGGRRGIRRAGNKSDSSAAARRGAGLCANGKESVRFPELSFANSFRR